MKTRIIKLEVVEIDDEIIENEQPKQESIYKDESEIDKDKYFDLDEAVAMAKQANVELNITGRW